jgi:CubicO group peptidase (beta-lactamase class C family)
MRGNLRALAICIALASVAASADQAASCGSPADLHDGWAVATPEQEGLDPLICGIGARLEALKEAKAHGVIIVRHGRLVYEHYFAGKDWRLMMPLGEVSFDAETKHDIRSISKSVTSLLVGIALDRGLLTDLDAPVFSFFPEYDSLRTSEKDRITLRHLLTMLSGLDWVENTVLFNDPANSYRQMGMAPIADYFVLAQPVVAPPGKVFNYNTGTVDLLGVILRKVSGKRLDGFAKEMLFNPLGIEDWDWEGFSGFNPAAASGLRLRPRDLAKIGQLVLQHGSWHGQQIVSSAWVDQSMTPRLTGEGLIFNGPEGISSYGYLWWLGRRPTDHPDHDLIAAAGNGGQRLYILPALDLVAVVSAGVYDRSPATLTAATVLNDFVLPAATEAAH